MGGMVSSLGQSTGLSNIGQGIVDLFTGRGGQQPGAPSPPGVPAPGGGGGAAPDLSPLLAPGPTPPWAPGAPVDITAGPAAGPAPPWAPPPGPSPTGVGPELVGPPSPYQSPNFLQGFAQGFLGQVPGAGADTPLSAGGEIGGGLGQLFHTINELRGAGGGRGGGQVPILGPIVNAVAQHYAGTETAPGYQQATRPEGGLIHKIIAAYTGGIIS